MKQSLQLKTTQQTTLTPQLQRSLEILQCSALELDHLIDTELSNNPLLELQRDAELTESNSQGEESFSPDSDAAEDENYQQNDVDQSSLHRLEADPQPVNDFGLENTLSAAETLQEHLLQQIGYADLRKAEQIIAEHIIYSLDEEGYLGSSLEEITQLLPTRLEATPADVEKILKVVQTLEPRGAGARSLAERLAILLNGLPSATPLLRVAKTIVAEHLELLAKRDFAALGKILNLDRQDLAATIELITTLNPRIANQFVDHQKLHIKPDVEVHKIGGQWVAKLNPETQRHLTINQEYVTLLDKNDAESSEFINKHLSSAKAFIRGIHSRYDTLLAVANVVVQRQRGFFDAGDLGLKGLTLREIGAQLELHESTISRAVAGKFLLCNQGVFSLKHFFTTAIGSADNGTSAAALRSMIKNMVAEESSRQPLSDSKIAEHLNSQGHAIARRTVAKYRESLHIAPSSKRKSLSAKP